MPCLVVAGQTHLGRVRSLNEDAWQIAPEADTGHLWGARGQLYVVADGMGGHAAGEVASQLALDTLVQQYYSIDETPVPPAIRLERAVIEANLDIYEQAVTVDSQAGMGTTLVAAVIHEDRLTIANVGDSRAYLVRDNEISQITNDHSWVAEQVKLGVMTDEQAQNHAYRNVVTRCLGHKPSIQVDIFEHRLRPGDVILMCSDGLSNQVPMEEMAHVLTDHPPAQAANTLIEAANDAGGPDNITAVIIQVIALAPQPEPNALLSPSDEDIDQDAEEEKEEKEASKPLADAHPLSPRDLAHLPISAREVAARITPMHGIPARLPPKDQLTPQRKRATVVLIVIALAVVAVIVVLIALRAEKLTRQLGWPAPLPPAVYLAPSPTSIESPLDRHAIVDERTKTAPSQPGPP